MRLLILLLGSILLTTNVFAQNPPPPPPRPVGAISTTTTEDVRVTDGFKINFPSKPTRTVSKIETGFGKTDMITYQLGTNLVFYAATFIDFPSVITDKAEISLRFDAVKTALLKAPESRLINEVEISFGGNPGAEYEIENKDTTNTTRVLMVDQRFFQLTVINRGKTSQATERVRNFNRKNVERFINSFSVTQLPAPKVTAVQLPADFGIKIQDNIFTSDHFGFSIKLPANWKLVDKEQTAVFMDLSAMNAENESEKVKKSLDVSLKNTEILLMMTKNQIETSVNEAVFAISAEKVSFPNFLPIKLAENFAKTFADQDKIVLKNPALINLSGVEFSFVELSNVEKNYKQRIYFANRNGIAFEILLIYKTEEDFKILNDSLQTMKFSEKNQ